MRLSKKHKDTRHKEVRSAKKKAEKQEYKLDKPLKSDPNEKEWQLEEKYLKKRNKDQLR